MGYARYKLMACQRSCSEWESTLEISKPRPLNVHLVVNLSELFL